VNDSQRITLTLEPNTDPLNRPVDVRMRLLLKHALRSLALKCVRIGPEPAMLDFDARGKRHDMPVSGKRYSGEG
jgi:hypothetical protein